MAGPTATKRAERLGFGLHRLRTLGAETEHEHYVKASEHLSSRLAAIAYLNKTAHPMGLEGKLDLAIFHGEANTGVTFATPDFQLIEFKSSGFSRAARKQLEGLYSDVYVVRDVLGSPNAQWFSCDLEQADAAQFERLLASALDAPAESEDEPSEAEHPEWQWIQRNEDWLHASYTGLWIAVVASQVVAVGNSPAEVFEYAAEFEKPFIYHVPSEAEPTVVA